MTSSARSTLKFYKREAIIAQLVPGFMFTGNELKNVMQLRYTHKIVKIIKRTGECIICSTAPQIEKHGYWIIGIKTLQFHLESGVFQKLLA